MSRRRSVVIVPLLALLVAGGIAAAMVSRTTTDVVLRTVTVGHAPYWTLALDERTGRAFIFNRQDGTLNVLDTRTGALLRTVTLAPGNVWLAVAERAGRVFVSGYDTGTITMLDARSGAVLHSVANGTDMGLAVDERTNRVFVGSVNSTVIMLDARSGIILRHLPACYEPFAVAVSVRTGHVFAKCDDGTTDMLDTRTGRVLRKIANNSGSYGSMLVDERTNRVFTVGNQPQLDVLDARTGAYLHTIAFDATALGPVADERTGRVYLTLGDANAVTAPPHKSEVVVLDGQSGALLRRVPVAANPFSLAVDPRTGHVLVGSAGPLDSLSDLPTGDGTLSVLDAARGRVLRAIRIGASPSDVAIDARAERALVVNSYSDTHGKGALKAWRPREGWWPRALRRIKQVICCLPFQAPPPPSPTTNGTVTTLDLSRF
jgi:DNA-binding beta-propeller fold protein YncE